MCNLLLIKWNIVGLLISQYRYYYDLYLLKSCERRILYFSNVIFNLPSCISMYMYTTNNDKSFYTENQLEYCIRIFLKSYIYLEMQAAKNIWTVNVTSWVIQISVMKNMNLLFLSNINGRSFKQLWVFFLFRCLFIEHMIFVVSLDNLSSG